LSCGTMRPTTKSGSILILSVTRHNTKFNVHINRPLIRWERIYWRQLHM
jgi:hypothetical protein